MIKQAITIQNKLGLHARAAMKFSDLATKFRASVSLTKDDRCIDAKSIMEVMVIGASIGTEVILQADGPDEQNAIDQLCQMINDKFGED